jgi:hypothetical protein
MQPRNLNISELLKLLVFQINPKGEAPMYKKGLNALAFAWGTVPYEQNPQQMTLTSEFHSESALEWASTRSARPLSDDADEGNRAIKLANVDATTRLSL